MTTDSAPRLIDTVVIGAGQAGLSAGYHLARRGRSFLIVDANRRIGDNWRSHWDSLRLYSPAGYDGLPGMPFPGDPHRFPTKDDVADYLEAYAARFDLPVTGGTRVRRLSRDGDRFLLDCGEMRIEAGNVVVATGTFGRTPSIPEFAAELDPRIVQLHSSEYRNPTQLNDGPVLVVGASHSGGDLAYEVATSHPTILCGRDTGQLPVRIESRRMRVLFPVLWFVWGHVLSVRTPLGRKVREHERRHGAPLLRVKREDLAELGVERITERVTGVVDGRPVLAGGRVLDVTNVLWCTGFRQVYDWIDLPVLSPDGWPLEDHGVVTDIPGLYFTGLCFQSSFRSMLVGGAGADAGHVVRHLVEHRAPVAAGVPTRLGAPAHGRSYGSSGTYATSSRRVSRLLPGSRSSR
ncbi:FAD-dependent oxidoreductase [Rhodococcus aetherivorans]|uniref:flavin-containing monooxygenase n=1 Tax=Rhodococcus aetherivorans TaxID=191292 RepID=UPI000622CA70|nr:FAD-dependent oxidoreductase [Rhodococcus aetherivorans]AKE89184.1 portal protein [Rhodococcus aetherivorans]